MIGAMVVGPSLLALAAFLATAARDPTATGKNILVATAVEPLRVEKLADALRTYLDQNRVEVRTSPAASSGDLRADVSATVQAGAGENAATVLRIAPTDSDTIEITLSDLPSERTLMASIPRSVRDEDLYRTLALKVQGMLRTLLEVPTPAAAVSTFSRTDPAQAAKADIQAGLTVLAFPRGDVTQEGALLRGRWALTEAWRLGLGLRLLPVILRESGPTNVRMRIVPLVASIERRWRSSRFEIAGGLVVLAEARHVEATEGKARTGDWGLVPGAGFSVAFAVRLSQSIRLALQAAAIGLPWSDRYQVDGNTVLDASQLEIPVDLTLDIAM